MDILTVLRKKYWMRVSLLTARESEVTALDLLLEQKSGVRHISISYKFLVGKYKCKTVL